MKGEKKIGIIVLYLLITLTCFSNKKTSNLFLLSPNESIKVNITEEHSQLYYEVYKDDNNIIEKSGLGVTFAETDFYKGLKIINTEKKVIDYQYDLLAGKQLHNHNYANELTITVENSNKKTMKIHFRAYNDGVAFNYEIKKVSEKLIAKDEHSEFNVNPVGFAWMQPYEWWSPAYENEFDNKIRIGKLSPKHREDGWSFPALFNIKNNWMLISEAGLDTNYCASHLKNKEDDSVYKIEYAIKEQGYKGGILYPEIQLPWKSPWRIMIIGSLSDVFESNLVYHVSEKSKIKDTSWIKPGRSSWSWLHEPASSKDFNVLKKYIDLSAKLHWEYSLIDANWNLMQNGDIHELIKYAKEKNVGLFVWYNSGGDHNMVGEQPRDIMNNADLRRAEFKKLQELGIKGIKVDFFQSDKQDIIQLYIDILEDAAKYKIMVNFHGCTLPRGWQRTYPNLMTMEAVKGGEFFLSDNKFPYEAGRHNAILPFTRNVVGSMDYTPVNFSDNVIPHITTNAHELALTIVFESGIFHFGDKAESYLKQPEVILKYLSEVPTVWDETRLLSGYPGKTCVVARRLKNDWYIGGINGYFYPTDIELDLSFLKEATFDGLVVQSGDTPKKYQIQKILYPQTSKLTIKLKAEDGFAIQLKKK